eukprot:SAG11_NODE_9695_length_889_cov_0.964557_3_plen_49_part_01
MCRGRGGQIKPKPNAAAIAQEVEAALAFDTVARRLRGAAAHGGTAAKDG